MKNGSQLQIISYSRCLVVGLGLGTKTLTFWVRRSMSDAETSDRRPGVALRERLCWK